VKAERMFYAQENTRLSFEKGRSVCGKSKGCSEFSFLSIVVG